ncbi:hypothetical protein [Acuticoccus sp.]|uniref:hypothetical protein n=1 Tax=Acuticoccus sp. TaxID=1904378 RepID=UPI003B51F974
MTDFYSVLQKAVQALPDGSGPQRRQVYEKARKALLKQLQSFDPPLSSADVTAQRLALEDAIRKIENEIARANRTRRAVQGVVPGGAAARDAEEPREGEAEREARRRAEAERRRAERAEMLKTAVSDELFAPQTGRADEAALPAPTAAPVAFEPARPPQTAVVDDVFEDEEPDDVVHAVPVRRGTPRRDARDEPEIDEVEYEPVEEDAYDDDLLEPAAAQDDPREDRRRRKAEERQLRADRRAERSDERRRRRAAAAGSPALDGRRRSVAARSALSVAVLVLLVGASYAAYTQRERLVAVLDGIAEPGVEEVRDPVPSAGPALARKDEERLLSEEDTRTVATTPIRIGAVAEGTADAATSGVAGAAPGEAEAERTVSEAPAAFGPQEATEPAEERVAAVDPQPTATDAASARPAEAIPDIVSEGTQRAVLYEEASESGQQGSALPGTVEWAMVRQSVGGGEDEEPVVRANAAIGERAMNATLLIRENRDPGLPASHLIEIEFDVPDSFEGGGVKNVPGIIMKERESARGEALRGAAARVSSGLFWIALSEDEADRAHNLELLSSRDWIDIPILYESGRRAILTLRKGNDGLRSVNAAIEEWTSG